MAGNEPQKQLLSLIRDFATEKSQGERRIENLKKRIEELRSAVNMENAKLDEVKHQKETIEQEIKGYEVELAMTEVSVLAVEARIVSAQGELSAAGSDLESLKNEEGAKRDDFIKRMFELNQRIREFQASFESALNEDYVGTRSANGVCEDVNAEDAEVSVKDIENKIAEITSQTNLEEEEYQTKLKVHELVQLELSDLENKASQIQKIMKENREMQDLTRYPLTTLITLLWTNKHQIGVVDLCLIATMFSGNIMFLKSDDAPI